MKLLNEERNRDAFCFKIGQELPAGPAGHAAQLGFSPRKLRYLQVSAAEPLNGAELVRFSVGAVEPVLGSGQALI